MELSDDEHVRRLERFWRETGSWDDWEKWAREARRFGNSDPFRLLRSIARRGVLEVRLMRLNSYGRTHSPEPGVEDRWDWLRQRVLTEIERTTRRLGILGRAVPHPPADRHAEDVRAIAVSIGVGAREALREWRSGPTRRHHFSTVARVNFARGRALSANEVARIRAALEMSRAHGTVTVVDTDGGDVEVRDGRVIDPVAAAAYVRSESLEADPLLVRVRQGYRIVRVDGYPPFDRQRGWYQVRSEDAQKFLERDHQFEVLRQSAARRQEVEEQERRDRRRRPRG
jgi:hypothetical protein